MDEGGTEFLITKETFKVRELKGDAYPSSPAGIDKLVGVAEVAEHRPGDLGYSWFEITSKDPRFVKGIPVLMVNGVMLQANELKQLGLDHINQPQESIFLFCNVGDLEGSNEEESESVKRLISGVVTTGFSGGDKHNPLIQIKQVALSAKNKEKVRLGDEVEKEIQIGSYNKLVFLIGHGGADRRRDGKFQSQRIIGPLVNGAIRLADVLGFLADRGLLDKSVVLTNSCQGSFGRDADLVAPVFKGKSDFILVENIGNVSISPYLRSSHPKAVLYRHRSFGDVGFEMFGQND